jgi:hypothetical protein
MNACVSGFVYVGAYELSQSYESQPRELNRTLPTPLLQHFSIFVTLIAVWDSVSIFFLCWKLAITCFHSIASCNNKKSA